jgi:hypothetical protein
VSIGKRIALFGIFVAALNVHAEAIDPTLPIDYMPPPPGMGSASQGVAVNMVVVRGGEAIALVNGRYVRINDMLDGSKVIAIGRNYVELKQGSTSVRHYLAGFGSSSESIK